MEEGKLKEGKSNLGSIPITQIKDDTRLDLDWSDDAKK